MILHSVAIADDWQITKTQGSFKNVAKTVIAKVRHKEVNPEQIRFILPVNSSYVPFKNKPGYEVAKFRVCINDGKEVRFKRGPLVALLEWTLQEYEAGRITENHSVFVTPVYRRK